MEKTINCADCGVEVIYNEKPGFPRKYCQVHSDARKASFKNASESKPTHTPQGEPLTMANGNKIQNIPSEEKVRGYNNELLNVPYKEQMYEKAPTETIPVEKIPSKEEMDKFYAKAKQTNGFHLAPEHTRSNALASANDWGIAFKYTTPEKVIELAKIFEKYILGDDEDKSSDLPNY